MPRRVTTSFEEAAALQAQGARLVRHAHDMELELPDGGPAEAPPPDGVTLRACVEAGPALTRAWLAAYPPGHPDVGPDGRSYDATDRELADLVAGKLVGPLIPESSATATDASGRLVGAVITSRLAPGPLGWAGGPWVSTVLVVPEWQGRGLGRTLMRHAIARCTAAGEARMGLTVTEGNPAEHLYAALGFERTRTLYVLEE
jgi:GNAT superfamily N-acetyltransferase